ncbi:protein FAM83H isoform X2 [Oryzias melastigma]|uniref:Family with sequence similarity 83 member Hb n=1 Tax=Oryzias melastigma TaxID=30732 RepID=A0A3B3C026_ORYME|nr:protein FAM83H isoform X2 [Oryzias melastigma]
MPHRSQSSSIGDNPLDPNYLPPHYREDYRLAIDALIEKDVQGYYEFLNAAEVVGFLAQPEIEYIRSTLQVPAQTSGVPELMYRETCQDEGSSDTYWPMQSDLAAPGLDLGWPIPQQSFVGPTEVTTLVNPSDPDMPSIKEQVRRLIKNARQVIGVVMDIFTDVDIFADLLEAASRHVPVYILLDQQEAHHFVSMVINCKVNLDVIHMMRVRTVPGITYYSRTGKSFKGQVKDRFILADCRAVLSGNYSFMWSYEKIHRSIAHLFLGELVSTFDEEFRILFAQSEPLIIDPSAAGLALPESSSFLTPQIGLKRTQSLRNPVGYRRQPELPLAFPYGESERNPAGSFFRNDPFRQTYDPGAGITVGKYSQQQFRMQQTFLEQGRSIVSRQMETNASSWKRHSYAEGTQENYSSSRQYMKTRVMNNLDETDFHREQIQSGQFYTEGPGPGSGHGHYNRLQGYPSHLPIDQRSNSSFRSDQEPPPGNYGDYFSSEDLRGPENSFAPPLAGRYGGGSSHKRPTMGQAYACLSSPTNPHPPVKKPFHKQSDQEHDQDESAKHGLRDWRINSYLSTYEDGGEEGLMQPMGSDAFDEPPPSQQPTVTESSVPHLGIKEPPQVPTKPRLGITVPRFGKPQLPESKKDPAPLSAKDLLPSRSTVKPPMFERTNWEGRREKEPERGGQTVTDEDMEVKETADTFLSRHDSFRSRVNPLLQRSSRLRSSLIFASSKGEIHSSSLGLKPASEQDEELDSLRTSSIVAQILEKRRSLSREPYDWRKKAEEREKEKEREKEEKIKEKQLEESKMQTKEETKAKEEPQKTSKETTQTVEKPKVTSDPTIQQQYSKDFSEKREATKKETDQLPKAPEPPEKKPDLSHKPPPTPATVPQTPTITVTSTESAPKKLDISAKLAELTRRPSISSSKPPIITAKPFVSSLKSAETLQSRKEENVSEGQKKDTLKSIKPLPSPKLFKKDSFQYKDPNPRRISSGEEILMKDATDAEKSEMKKSRSHSSSTLPHEDSKEGLRKVMGSNTSINTVGEGKSEGKPLDFLKKQTQRLKGFLGPKDKEKKSSGDNRSTNTVTEVNEDLGKTKTSSDKITGSAVAEHSSTNHKTSTETSVLSSQKNRQEREEMGAGLDGTASEKGIETQSLAKKNRFLRPQSNSNEREGLLKRIESFRKEKKVYSRFEMGNSLA